MSATDGITIEQSVGWVTDLANAWATVEMAKREDRNYYIGAQEASRNSFADGVVPLAPYDPAQYLGTNYIAPSLDTGEGGGPVTRSQSDADSQKTVMLWVGVAVLSVLGLGFLVKG